MTEQHRDEAMQGIRKTQENFALGIGITIAMLLSAYFFTYAQLADHGLSGLLWFEAISSVVMVVMLLQLKRISFFCAKLLLGRRARYRETLASMTAADLSSK